MNVNGPGRGCRYHHKRIGYNDKRSRINFNEVSDEHFDDPMGDATGAGVIFGATAVLWKRLFVPPTGFWRVKSWKT